MRQIIGLLFLLILSQANSVLAASDPELRLQKLYKSFRCIPCGRETIYESQAGFASELRLLIKEQVENGQDDQMITTELINRYGDNISYAPPFTASTAILWLGPAIIALFGLKILYKARCA